MQPAARRTTPEKSGPSRSSPPPRPDVLLRPMLRAGRWVILVALIGALLAGDHYLDKPGVRPRIGVALALYALLSTGLLRSWSLTAARVAVIVSLDLALVALMVECTGGIHSPFFGLYYLVIVASGIFYGIPGGLIAVSLITLITSLSESLGVHGVRHVPLTLMVPTLSYMLLAAVIAGYLTTQLRQEIERHRAAQHAALVLEMERRSAEREMALAREVQQAALPATPAGMAGLEIGIRFRAAAEVGGDFYDFYQGDNELRLLVGDAGGKGVPAALVATTAMHLFHTQAPDTSLADWCRDFNRELEERAPTYMLATAFCCALDARSGEGTWVNAGHPPPVLCRRGRAPELLEGSGMSLGVLEDTQYVARPIHLAPGDLLVIYTDGLSEAVLQDGTRADVGPLLAQLPALMLLSAAQIAERIEARLVETAEVRDDLTILVIKKEANGEAAV
jgi:serine phosphatase RsbU (regulator of sigma subunit)